MGHVLLLDRSTNLQMEQADVKVCMLLLCGGGSISSTRSSRFVLVYSLIVECLQQPALCTAAAALANAMHLRKLRILPSLGGCFLQGVRLLLIDESPADCCESLVTHQRSLRGGSSPDRASSSCSTDVGVGLLAPPFSNNSSRYGELGESSRSPMKSSVRLPWHSSTCHGHHFITGLLQLGTAMC